MSPVPSRRSMLAMAGAAALAPHAAHAEAFIDLDWEDLLPAGAAVVPPELQALIDHDGPDLSAQQPASSGVRSDWNGQIIRLPGFIVPIDYKGGGVTAFILAPFVGACIHVPPPPANQLVFVTTEDPYEMDGLYSPVNVIGMFGISSISTQLAQVGYALSAEKIEPFRR